MELLLHLAFVTCIALAVLSALLRGEFTPDDAWGQSPVRFVCAMIFGRMPSPWVFAIIGMLFFLVYLVVFGAEIVPGGYYED